MVYGNVRTCYCQEKVMPCGKCMLWRVAQCLHVGESVTGHFPICWIIIVLLRFFGIDGKRKKTQLPISGVESGLNRVID